MKPRYVHTETEHMEWRYWGWENFHVSWTRFKPGTYDADPTMWATEWFFACHNFRRFFGRKEGYETQN